MERNRWDRPLITLEAHDETPLQQIQATLFGELVEKPLRNPATEFVCNYFIYIFVNLIYDQRQLSLECHRRTEFSL